MRRAFELQTAGDYYCDYNPFCIRPGRWTCASRSERWCLCWCLLRTLASCLALCRCLVGYIAADNRVSVSLSECPPRDQLLRLSPTEERKVNPWFGHHKARELYVSLLSLEQVPPRQILVAALLNRAKEDVKLIWSIRDAKQAMHQLLQKGQIGDETWETLLAAEKELEREIVEVVQEANTFQPGYGQQIFAVASDMASRSTSLLLALDLIQSFRHSTRNSNKSLTTFRNIENSSVRLCFRFAARDETDTSN